MNYGHTRQLTYFSMVFNLGFWHNILDLVVNESTNDASKASWGVRPPNTNNPRILHHSAHNHHRRNTYSTLWENSCCSSTSAPFIVRFCQDVLSPRQLRWKARCLRNQPVFDTSRCLIKWSSVPNRLKCVEALLEFAVNPARPCFSGCIYLHGRYNITGPRGREIVKEENNSI